MSAAKSVETVGGQESDTDDPVVGEFKVYLASHHAKSLYVHAPLMRTLIELSDSAMTADWSCNIRGALEIALYRYRMWERGSRRSSS